MTLRDRFRNLHKRVSATQSQDQELAWLKGYSLLYRGNEEVAVLETLDEQVVKKWSPVYSVNTIHTQKLKIEVANSGKWIQFENPTHGVEVQEHVPGHLDIRVGHL